MRSIQIFLAVAITLTSLSLYGHHSPFIFFDSKRTIEIEGTLSYIKWGNPHPRFRIEARDDNGNSVTWSIEVHSYSILRRMDLDFDVIGVGDTVKIAGWPAVRRENSMFVTNMLLSDGSEIPFYPGVPARYSDNIRGDSKTWLVSEDDIPEPIKNDAGIFHVWSTSLADIPKAMLFGGVNFPLTKAAIQEREEYDIYDNPIFGQCVFKGKRWSRLFGQLNPVL